MIRFNVRLSGLTKQEYLVTHDETNHKYTCSTCKYFETENHTFEFFTNDFNGETHTEKCICGEMHSVAHDYTSYVGDTGDGVNHNAYCECGAYTAEEHVYNSEFSDAGDGTHYVHCLCGAYTIQEHTYDQVIVTREPVDGMPGEKQHTCQCGATSNSTEFISYIDINEDGVIDVEDYQLIVNEALSDGNEQSGTAEYDEIIKYDLDGDGYIDVLDCALMALIVNGHKTFVRFRIFKKVTLTLMVWHFQLMISLKCKQLFLILKQMHQICQPLRNSQQI